jgi:hypothetical protein
VLSVTVVAVEATVNAGGVANVLEAMRLALVEKAAVGVYITWNIFGAQTFIFIFPACMAKLSPSASWVDDVTGTGAANTLIDSRPHTMHTEITLKIFMLSPSF